jgi:hypothetical protein
VSVSLFGTIIAEVNEVLMHMRTKTKGLEKVLESYLEVHPRYVFRTFVSRRSSSEDSELFYRT